MCEAAVTIITVPAAPHQFYRDFVVVHIVPNLLKRPVQKERRDRVAHGYEAALGEARGHTDHELFGRAHVNRPVREVPTNIVQNSVAQIGSNQKNP